MKQLTPSCSYSWWRDSRNSPTQSAWLHNTLGELEEKTQAMLSLVEAEADSFAQRAELFYHKRPQLISMIEDQYRAYRSLAEQYDHLKFGFRQNIRESVQIKCGLSCKAPLESPFRRQISGSMNPLQRFKEFLTREEKCGSKSEEVSEIVCPKSGGCNQIRVRDSDKKSVSMAPSNQEPATVLSCSDSVEASYVVDDSETENVGSIISEMEVKMETETSFLRKQLTEKIIQVKQLEMANNKLKEEKASWNEDMSLVVQERSFLQEELKIIKAENTKLRNESTNLHKELQFIRDENTKLWYENEINVQQPKVLTKKVSNLQKGNKNYKNTNLRDEIEANKENVCNLAEENTKLCTQMDVEIRLEKNEKIVLEQSLRLGDLQNEVHQLLEENKKHEIEVLERDEQKREAIRQLCFTIDTLMDKNKRLHNVLQKLQGKGGSKPNQIGHSPSQISWWKKFLNGGWWI